MFLSRNKKNNVYPCKPQFYYIKVGLTGVSIIKACFRDVLSIKTFFSILYFTGREDPDQTAQMRSLIRALSVRVYFVDTFS